MNNKISTMMKLIIKLLVRISQLSISSIIKLIYNIFTKNKTVKSFSLLFKWLSILFTVLYLIRDTSFITFLPPLYFLDIYFGYLTLSKFKFLWDKLIDWLISKIEGFKVNKPKIETELPQPWLTESDPTRTDYIDSDQLDLKKRNKPRVKIGDGYGHEWDVESINAKNKVFIALMILVSGVMVVTVISDTFREVIMYPIGLAYSSLWYIAKIPMNRFMNVVDYITKLVNFFDKEPKKSDDKKPELGNAMEEDDMEGLEGDPDTYLNIIRGTGTIKDGNLRLNLFSDNDILFDASDDGENKKTPIQSGQNSPLPSTSNVGLDPQTSSGGLHPDIIDVTPRSRSRSPIHTNNPELQDLIHGNARRYWDDSNFKDILDVFN